MSLVHGGRMRGLASVELAVILPVFVLLMMGVAELGHAFYEYNTLTKAVRAGAGFIAREANVAGLASVSSANRLTTQQVVVYGVPGGTSGPVLPGLATGDVTVVVSCTTCVTVTATYDYTPLFSVIPSFGLGANDTNAPGTMSSSMTVEVL